MSTISDLTEVVGLIVTRLRAELPAGNTVERLAEFADIDFSAWPCPAVYVVYGSHTPTYDAGESINVEQLIHVVPVVDNAHDIAGGGSPDTAGGTLAVLCIKALQNWTPAEHFTPMNLQPGNAIDFAPGRLLFPLTFKTETALQGHIDLDQ